MNRFDPAQLLASMSLTRVDGPSDAGLCIASLPVLRGDGARYTFADRPTLLKPLGRRAGASSPVRWLMVGDSGGQAPELMSLQPEGSSIVTPATPTPAASSMLFEQSDDPRLPWHRHFLKLNWGGQEIGLAMGLRVAGEVHWWEACRLVTVEESPLCRQVQMAGAIPHTLLTVEEFQKKPGYKYPLLHVHNWVNGSITARLHANGVCEIFARHVNARYVDDGLSLHDAVPVVGIWAQPSELDAAPTGPWDGSMKRVSIGGATFDLSHVAPLVSPRQPGQFDREGQFLVWQPYTGMELFSGLNAQDRVGQPYVYRAEEHVIPRGMARTLRFSLSLNPERSPAVARYLAPAWWYGLCEEFAPAPLLPVSDRFDISIGSAQKFLREHMVENGFEDGSLPRGLGKTFEGRHEPGWEGEAAGAALLLAYRTGESQDYQRAMRAAYCYHDVYVDHAAKIGRCHGYFPPAINLPMSRVHACVYAWLETGDSFCLDTARAVIENCYWAHKNSWPRLAVGRDACFIRGAMLLYRVLGDEHFLEIARDMIADVCESQSPAGWFGDQGGGSGIHAWGAYHVKPWMGFMAVGGLLDFLDLLPDGDARALECVKRFADWLMSERFDHGDGKFGWSYQHLFNDKRELPSLTEPGVTPLPTPGLWHMDYLARLMTFCSMRWNDPKYYNAFMDSYESTNAASRGGDHSFAQSVQYLPWLQAMTWRATLDEQGQVKCNPLNLSSRAPQRGLVMSPQGPQPCERAGSAT